MIRQVQLLPPALRRKDVILVIVRLSLILKWRSKYQLVNTLKSLNWIYQLDFSKKPTLAITPVAADEPQSPANEPRPPSPSIKH